MTDNLRLKELAGLTEAKKWSAKVETKWEAPEGFFEKPAAAIVKGLVAAHKDHKAASSSLNFYINRQGKNMDEKDKARLDNAKELLKKHYEVKESALAALRKMSGIPAKPLTEDAADGDPTPEEQEAAADKGEGDNADKDGKKKKNNEEEEDDLPKVVKKLAKAVAKKFGIGDPKQEGKDVEELEELLLKVYEAGVKDGMKQKEEGSEGKEPKAEKEPKEEPKEEPVEEGYKGEYSLLSDAEIHRMFSKISSTSSQGTSDAKKKVEAEMKKRGIRADVFKGK
jgi:hypothetical protein